MYCIATVLRIREVGVLIYGCGNVPKRHGRQRESRKGYGVYSGLYTARRPREALCIGNLSPWKVIGRSVLTETRRLSKRQIALTLRTGINPYMLELLAQPMSQ